MSILNKVTLQSLKKNKVRTIVTIIGIILSTAMFTAVTTSIASIRGYMIKTIISDEGSWEGMIYGLSAADYAEVGVQDDVKRFTGLCDYGYMQIDEMKRNGGEMPESGNGYKPYLRVASIVGGQQDAEELVRFTLLSGRMPERSNEILIPSHLAQNGVSLKIGDTLTGSIGQREYMGQPLGLFESYQVPGEQEDGGGENLVRRQEERTWTVVGIYKRFSYTLEPYNCPGFTVLTGPQESHDGDASYLISFLLKDRKQILEVMKELQYSGFGSRVDYHSDLLRMDGISGMQSFTRVFNGLAVILCIIIVFGSVALIFNAFSISVNERMKQFGLLASVGATKRQLKKSVRFEACAVSIIGIPLGILAGIAGMSITFYALRYRFVGLFSSSRIPLTLQADWRALLLAAALAFATVLLSASIPARRAMRVPVIEAIRQNNVIQVPNRKLRTPGFLYRLFGMSGVLADKNFRRNRKKYRATVISLFVSIVLFVSASSFVAYLQSSVDSVAVVRNFDFQYWVRKQGEHTAQEIFELIAGTEGIARVSLQICAEKNFMLEPEALDEEFHNWKSKQIYYSPTAEELFAEGTGMNRSEVGVLLHFLSDEDYRAYTAENGLSEAGYFGENKNALVFDNVLQYTNGKYGEIRYMKEESGTLSVYWYDIVSRETQDAAEPESADGTDVSATDYSAEGGASKNPHGMDVSSAEQELPDNKDGMSEEQTVIIRTEEDSEEWILQIEKEKRLNYRVTDAELPLGIEKNSLTFLYPESAMAELFPDLSGTVSIVSMTASGDKGAVYERLQKTLLANSIDTGALHNYYEQDAFQRNLIVIVNVFSYGFIALISLIAAANVFNTISTNISLRRREFAMLESIGMTKKGLYRMLNYECLLYGIKSLLYGMPVALLLTFAIYCVVSEGYAASFYVPAASIMIAVVSVFSVVFATMFYAAGKLRKNSVVETLKNENV